MQDVFWLLLLLLLLLLLPTTAITITTTTAAAPLLGIRYKRNKTDRQPGKTGGNPER